MLRPVLLVVVLLALGGCKTLSFFGGDEGANVTYAQDAETNLKKGDEALDSKSYVEAQHYFDFVKSKYPYLEAAKTAELRLADTDFARERYAEARDRYQNFVKLHPTHAKVDYAAYRAALTYFKETPSDFFLFPPAEEKDQGSLRSAQVALNDFVRSYPRSEHLEEAKKVLAEVRKRLADHELYVASFYRSRSRWPAVINRLNTVARDFGDLGLDEQVYLGLYDAYSKLKDDAKAKEALRTLIAKAPNTSGAKKAQALLGEK